MGQLDGEQLEPMRTGQLRATSNLTAVAGVTDFPSAFVALQTGACSTRWTHLQRQICSGGPDSFVLNSIAAWRSAGCTAPLTRSGLFTLVLCGEEDGGELFASFCNGAGFCSVTVARSKRQRRWLLPERRRTGRRGSQARHIWHGIFETRTRRLCGWCGVFKAPVVDGHGTAR